MWLQVTVSSLSGFFRTGQLIFKMPPAKKSAKKATKKDAAKEKVKSTPSAKKVRI
jgi:hypothetical protein